MFNDKSTTPLLKSFGMLSVSENMFLSEEFSVGILWSQNEERQDNLLKMDKQIGKANVTWIF